MKFLCDRSRLEAALAPILPAVPTKDLSKPALKSLYLEARDDLLVLRGSNIELSVEIRVDSVKVDRPGAFLVPARPFHALVHELPDPTVRVEVSGETLVVPTSSGKFEIVTGNADDFPELEFAQEGRSVQLPTEILARHYQAVEFACAREATRYAMNGILLALKDGKLVTVATDGRRLGLITSNLETSPDLELQALLPHKSLGAAVKAMENLAEETVEVCFAGPKVVFSASGGSVSVQCIQGSFPDYDTVIPRDCSNTVEFNRALLEANLRRSIVLAEDINPAVRMSFTGSQAKFESEVTGVGTAETVMDVDLSGNGGHIIFNPYFLIEVLRVVQEDVIRFEFDDANLPGKFILGEEYLYVVMPITGV